MAAGWLQCRAFLRRSSSLQWWCACAPTPSSPASTLPMSYDKPQSTRQIKFLTPNCESHACVCAGAAPLMPSTSAMPEQRNSFRCTSSHYVALLASITTRCSPQSALRLNSSHTDSLACLGDVLLEWSSLPLPAEEAQQKCAGAACEHGQHAQTYAM